MMPGDKVQFRIWRMEKGKSITDTRKGEILSLYDRYARIRSEDGKVFDLPVESLTSSPH